MASLQCDFGSPSSFLASAVSNPYVNSAYVSEKQPAPQRVHEWRFLNLADFLSFFLQCIQNPALFMYYARMTVSADGDEVVGAVAFAFASVHDMMCLQRQVFPLAYLAGVFISGKNKVTSVTRRRTVPAGIRRPVCQGYSSSQCRTSQLRYAGAASGAISQTCQSKKTWRRCRTDDLAKASLPHADCLGAACGISSCVTATPT